MKTATSTNSQHVQARSEALLAALRRAHLRITPQRAAICEYLAETRSHPTIQDIFTAIHARYPAISRATIYNTMATLKELGEIIELPSPAGASVHYETDLQPHVNLTCSKCGTIYDVPLEGMSELLQRVDASTDFQVQGLLLSGYGLCARCQNAAQE